jgi:hypothetical protein
VSARRGDGADDGGGQDGGGALLQPHALDRPGVAGDAAVAAGAVLREEFDDEGDQE